MRWLQEVVRFAESPSTRDVQLSSLESNPAAKELRDFLHGLKDSAASDVVKQVGSPRFCSGLNAGDESFVAAPTVRDEGAGTECRRFLIPFRLARLV